MKFYTKKSDTIFEVTKPTWDSFAKGYMFYAVKKVKTLPKINQDDFPKWECGELRWDYFSTGVGQIVVDETGKRLDHSAHFWRRPEELKR